jgi:hypothetical protein
MKSINRKHMDISAKNNIKLLSVDKSTKKVVLQFMVRDFFDTEHH